MDDDLFNRLFAKMIEADALLLGTPTYFSGVSAEMKALLDRAGLVAIANGGLLRKKIGAAVVAVRRGGGRNGSPPFRSGNDYYSVAFWYQTEPHARFPVLPSAQARISWASETSRTAPDRQP
jgi:multimeric flavodoxin WrbA